MVKKKYILRGTIDAKKRMRGRGRDDKNKMKKKKEERTKEKLVKIRCSIL